MKYSKRKDKAKEALDSAGTDKHSSRLYTSRMQEDPAGDYEKEIRMIPLATRMRPSKLQDFVGQTHFMFEGSLFYNSIKNKNL